MINMLKGSVFGFSAGLNDSNTARDLGAPLFAFGVKSKANKSFVFGDLKLTLTTAAPEPGEMLLSLAGICLVVRNWSWHKSLTDVFTDTSFLNNSL